MYCVAIYSTTEAEIAFCRKHRKRSFCSELQMKQGEARSERALLCHENGTQTGHIGHTDMATAQGLENGQFELYIMSENGLTKSGYLFQLYQHLPSPLFLNFLKAFFLPSLSLTLKDQISTNFSYYFGDLQCVTPL